MKSAETTTWNFYAIDTEDTRGERFPRGEKQWGITFPAPKPRDYDSKYREAVAPGTKTKMSGIVLKGREEIPTEYLRGVFDCLIEALGIPFEQHKYVFACAHENGWSFPAFAVGSLVPHPTDTEKRRFIVAGYLSPQGTSAFNE